MNESFRSKKALQAVVYLARLGGGSVDRYSLIKMMYLADRESLSETGQSITGDRAYSLEYGPILSNVARLTKQGEMPDELWDACIERAGEDNAVRVMTDPGQDLLTKRDCKIIERVFAKLGNMTFRQLREWSHGLPEYEEVGRGRAVIPLERLLAHLGKSPAQISAIMEANKEEELLRVMSAP